MVLEVSGSAVFLLDAVDGCNFATGLGFGRAECVDGPRASMNKSDSFNSAFLGFETLGWLPKAVGAVVLELSLGTDDLVTDVDDDEDDGLAEVLSKAGFEIFC